MQTAEYLKIGLTTQQVHEAHGNHGRNELKTKPPPSDFNFVIRQFQNPLVIVLVVAGIITLGLQEYADSLVIGLAVAVNTILGFIQERNASRSLEALKKVLTPQSIVVRDGQQQTIDARGLVPGDVVLLYDGDKVPADGVIVKSTDLLINEAILTGESVPVGKFPVSTFQFQEINKKYQDQTTRNSKLETRNLSYMGTIVESGSGAMVVTHTGMSTEIGKIAASLETEAEATPLEKRLSQLAKWITIIILITSALVFAYGLLIAGYELEEMFTLTVALAVAAIPEGLVVSLTAILAIGMQRILKRRALVRKLVAAETLGTVTVVCVDKTGTLTEGKLRVVDADFTDLELGLRASALANDLRDPTEIARWSWLREQARKKTKFAQDPKIWTDEYPRDDSIPFSSEAKFLATRHGHEIFVVGAPEVVLEWTTSSRNSKLESRNLIQSWGSQGRRMVGLAYLKASSSKQAETVFKKLKNHDFKNLQLQWLGLIAYADPIRKGVAHALKQAGSAGISVKVITGDYRPTAEAVLKKLGISLPNGSVIEGFELEKMSDEVLQSRINDIKLFARTKPNQKMRIVQALKASKQVVAMMGDGVNDAPAINASDIGIVVGDATEVAREAADIVLLDSNFKTILAAVAEGRGIFDNIRKIVLYLVSNVFTEMILVVGSLVAGWPLAITAVQILWVNLVGDGLPNLALTVDPRDPSVLKRKPVEPDLPLISRKMLVIMAVIGISSSVVGLSVFGWALPRLGVEVARTMAFMVLGVDSLFYVYSCRMLTKNIWQESLLTNKWLTISVVAGAILMVLPVYTPGLNTLLGTAPLKLSEWIIVIASGFLVVASVEAVKWVWRKV